MIKTRTIPDGDSIETYGGSNRNKKRPLHDKDDDGDASCIHQPHKTSCNRWISNSTTSDTTIIRCSKKTLFFISVSILAFFRTECTFHINKTLYNVLVTYQSRELTNVATMSDIYYTYTNIIDNSSIDQYYNHQFSFESNTNRSYEELLHEYNIPMTTATNGKRTSSTKSKALHDISNSMKQDGFDPWMLYDNTTTYTRIHDIHQTYRKQRQQRSRPPILQSNTKGWTIAATETISLSSVKRIPVGKQTTIEITSDTKETSNQHYNWKDLCKNANLSKDSRVIVTNALSTSIGTPFILLLYKQCHVKNIMIVDAMLPNIKKERIIYMNTYRTLFRTIPTLQLTVPTNTAGFGIGGSSSSGSSDSSTKYTTTKWIDTYRPSHILHLENIDSAILDSHTVWGEHMAVKAQQLYHIQNSILPIQQILEYCHHQYQQQQQQQQQQHNTASTKNPLAVLHISQSSIITNPMNRQHSIAMNSINNQRLIDLHSKSVLHNINIMMADYLYTRHDLDDTNKNSNGNKINLFQMHHLQLPYVYGPIMNSSVHNRTKDVINESSSTSIYIDDAIVGILKALHTSQKGDRQLMTLSSTISTTSQWHQDLTYAYELQDKYPFGGIEYEHYMKNIHQQHKSLNVDSYRNAISWVNDLYGLEETRFPCASTCYDINYNNDKTNAGICEASIWDMIYPISQSITEGCTNVIYYVNFDPMLDQLLGPVPNDADTTETTSDTICRIAFVSGTSIIVREQIKEQNDSLKNSKKMNDMEAIQNLNGKISINGTTIIWIPETIKITNAEHSLIKIDPSRFFTSSVMKAMYVESNDMMILSNERISEQYISNSIHDAHDEPYTTQVLRNGFDNVYRTIHHPPSKERSVTFVASEVVSIDKKPTNLVKYMLQKNMTHMKGRHFNYYKQLNHYIQMNMNRPVNDYWDNTLPWIYISMKYMIHNLQSPVAHVFRCQWLDAHYYWGKNNIIYNTEDLTLSYVLTKQRLEGNIGLALPDDDTWISQLDRLTTKQLYIDETNTKEAFLRFMKG
jgi:hypothetical protein